MRIAAAIAKLIDSAIADAIALAFGVTNPAPKPRVYVEPEPDTGTYDPYAQQLADAAPEPDNHPAPNRCSGCCS